MDDYRARPWAGRCSHSTVAMKSASVALSAAAQRVSRPCSVSAESIAVDFYG